MSGNRRPIDPPARPVLITAAVGVTAAVSLIGGFITAREGRVNVPYRDIANVLTVCDGHVGADIQQRRYSDAECARIRDRDIERTAAPLVECISRPLPVNTLAATISLAYNVGPQNVCRSTVVRRINAGDYAGACDAFMMWNKARVRGQLVAVRGLTIRRAEERELCRRGLS